MVKSRRRAGFTVTEVTIALAIITVVAGALLTAGPQALRGTAAAYREARAERLAQQMIERACGAESAPEAGDQLFDDGAYRGQLVVVEREPGLIDVTAIVTWTQPGDTEPSNVRLATLLAQESGR